VHPYKRSARVSDLIREEVADIIMNKIKHKTSEKTQLISIIHKG
jgi:ribosome-binding factor A